jgi:hypothetical protein
MKALRDKLASFFSGLFGKRRMAKMPAGPSSTEQAARH